MNINTPESLLHSKQIGETVNAAMNPAEELRTAIVTTRDRRPELRGNRKIMDCLIGTVRSRISGLGRSLRLKPPLDVSPDKRW